MSTRFWKGLIALYLVLGPLCLWIAFDEPFTWWWPWLSVALWVAIYVICWGGIRAAREHERQRREP